MSGKSKNGLYKLIGGIAAASIIAIGMWWLNSLDEEEEINNFIVSENNSNNKKSHNTKTKLVISGKNILLKSSNPSEFNESKINALHKLSKNFDIYIVIQVKDENEQEQIFNSISKHDIFTLEILDIKKVLFCSTSQGKGHIARHIEPIVYIDDCEENIDHFSKYIPKTIYINSSNSKLIKDKNNIEIAKSIENCSLI